MSVVGAESRCPCSMLMRGEMAARYEAWECGCRLLEFPSCRFKVTMVSRGGSRTHFCSRIKCRDLHGCLRAGGAAWRQHGTRLAIWTSAVAESKTKRCLGGKAAGFDADMDMARAEGAGEEREERGERWACPEEQVGEPEDDHVVDGCIPPFWRGSVCHGHGTCRVLLCYDGTVGCCSSRLVPCGKVDKTTQCRRTCCGAAHALFARKPLQ